MYRHTDPVHWFKIFKLYANTLSLKLLDIYSKWQVKEKKKLRDLTKDSLEVDSLGDKQILQKAHFCLLKAALLCFNNCQTIHFQVSIAVRTRNLSF